MTLNKVQEQLLIIEKELLMKSTKIICNEEQSINALKANISKNKSKIEKRT